MLDGGAGQRLRVHLDNAAGRHGDRRDGARRTQAEASLKALKHCLEAAGTSLEKVVMVRIYAVNSGFYTTINRGYAKYFAV
nr:Rid family hydrolase [Mesorhizobium sp. B2-4-6]